MDYIQFMKKNCIIFTTVLIEYIKDTFHMKTVNRN